MQNLKSNAASIIASNVRSLDGIATHSPWTMSPMWNSLFDNVKTGKVRVNINNVTSSRWDVNDAFFMDDASESSMLSSILHNDTVELNSVSVDRQQRFRIGKYGAYLVKDPHVVDYVLCHVKGYKKYFFGKGFHYVKGRDVIISGTLLAITDIIDMMKSEIESLIQAEN